MISNINCYSLALIVFGFQEHLSIIIVFLFRYLVQTLRDYPKLLIALISKSAEGIGAVFLSLFDMICDEVSLAYYENGLFVTIKIQVPSFHLFTISKAKINRVLHSCEKMWSGKKRDNSLSTCHSTVTELTKNMNSTGCIIKNCTRVIVLYQTP